MEIKKKEICEKDEKSKHKFRPRWITISKSLYPTFRKQETSLRVQGKDRPSLAAGAVVPHRRLCQKGERSL